MEEKKQDEKISINEHRNIKEKSYFTIMAIVGGIIWGVLFMIFLFVPLPFYVKLLLVAFIIGPSALIIWLNFKVRMAGYYGDSFLLNKEQNPVVFDEVERMSRRLGIHTVPPIFIVSDWKANSFARNFIFGKIILLNSKMVEAALYAKRDDIILSSIAFNLARYAAGHVDPFKQTLIMP